jgi:acetolactate synthase-1/2/3 large subunit
MKNPNFIGLVEAYSIQAKKVTERKDLRQAVKEMLDSPNASFLEVVVEKEENVFPMVPTGAGVGEIILEQAKK